MDAVESIAFVGENPWWLRIAVALGVTVTDPSGRRVHRAETFRNVWDAITLGEIDWRVLKNKIFLADGTEVEDWFALTRETDGKVLGGPVGSRYEVLQIETVSDMFQFIVDNAGLEIISAMSLDGGNTVCIQGKWGDDVEVIPGDPIFSYFNLSHSHGGKSSVWVGGARERIVCRNTLNIAKRTGKYFKFRHTKNLDKALEAVGRCIVDVTNQFETNLEDFRTIARAHVGSEEDLRSMARVALEPPKPKVVFPQEKELLDAIIEESKESTQMKNTLDLIVDNFEQESGRTWWHGYNAVTQYLTHQASGKPENRMKSLLFNGYRAKQGTKALAYAYNAATGKTETVELAA